MKLYIAALLIFPTSILCMHTTLTTATKFKHSRTCVLTSKSFDPEQSRREAYQKYCPIQITWDQHITQQNPKMELKPNNSKKNDCGYWSQYTKK